VPGQADALNTLHTLKAALGANPPATPILARDGNLYGVAQSGGANDAGVLFKITKSGTYTVLHSFSAQSGLTNSDGAHPLAALIQAGDGNLYGTCCYGGNEGDGTVFKVTPGGGFTTLYSFTGGPDGANPQAALVQASDGNLYGVCARGGGFNTGTIFRITLGGVFTLLHTFSASSAAQTNSDGINPQAALIQASDGNLYGTAVNGGTYGFGTIFRITLRGIFTTFYSFSTLNSTGTNSDGANPVAALIQAGDGDLYGTAVYGGTGYNGTIFRITLRGAFTTLYSFSALNSTGTNLDGANPMGLILASDGDLYGAAQNGGADNFGTLFKITTGGAFTTLYNFTGDTDGANPVGMIQAGNGSFYGAAFTGETTVNGTVFSFTTAPPAITSLSPASVAANTAFTLTLNGSAFDQNAVVEWGGQALKTTYISDTQLKAAVTTAINAPLSAYPGSARISVVNPDGSTASATLSITVPAPVLKSLSPTSLPHGSPASTLTLTGIAFAPGATVNWNGTALATTFLSPSKLTATIPASALAAKGTAQVSVTNPSGGGTSKSQTFTIK
jgi:uncharacterized repeat protein (TIGR03803 family)